MNRGFLLRLGAAITTAAFLAAAFPPFEEFLSIWMGLIPLFILAAYTRPAASFRWGMLSGTLFWIINLSWLLKLHETAFIPVHWIVAALGLIGLAVYCSLYTGIFTYVLSFWFKKAGYNRWSRNLLTIVCSGLVWSGLEWLRSVLFSGFAWNFLGVSQYSNLGLIQVAEYGGVLLISAMIVIVNASLSMLILRRLYHIKHGGKTMFHPELTIALLILGFSIVNGNGKMKHIRKHAEYDALFVGIVQPAIKQDQKWLEENSHLIFDEVMIQTRLLLQYQNC